MSEGQVVLAYILIALNVVVVGLLLYHRHFGCYSKKHQEQEEERIANLVVRQLYRLRQEDTLTQLDHLRRDAKPEDFEEDCA